MKPQSLRIAAGAAHVDPPAEPAGESIRSWLSIMVGMIGASESERRAVREELESHVRERVRDLMVSGLTEAEASRQAIAELGDAAQLARRYQEAIGPSKRRLIMQVAALSFAGAAAVISVVALSGQNQSSIQPSTQPSTPSQNELAATVPDTTALTTLFERAIVSERAATDSQIRAKMLEERLLVAAAESAKVEQDLKAAASYRLLLEPRLAALEERALTGRVFTEPEDPARTALSQRRVDLPDSASWADLLVAMTPEGYTADVRREQFQKAEISLEQPLGIGAFSGTAAAVLDVMNNTVCTEAGTELGVRVEGDRIIFAPASYFDTLEKTLAVYDLSPLIRAREERGEDPQEVVGEVIQIITGFVYPDQWESNGGTIASTRSFESKLFVQAPKRFHPRVSWILSELGAKDAAAHDARSEIRVPVILNALGRAARVSESANARVALKALVSDDARAENPGTPALQPDARNEPAPQKP